MIGDKIKNKLHDVRERVSFSKGLEMGIIPSVRTKIEEVSLNVKERIGGKTESRLTKESRPRQTSVRHLPTISPKTIGPQTLPRPKNKKRGF